MDFVPCVKWVRRGLIRGNPDKIELTREELQQIIRESRPQDSQDEESCSGSEGEENGDRYDMEHYDEEPENYSRSMGIGSLALFEHSDRDANINIPGMDEQDTDDEDDEIKPDDNLIIVGKGFRDNSGMENLEIHVYEQDSNMYPHHDIMLSSCPLSLEIVHVDGEQTASTFVVAGLMSGLIEMYDVNVINPIKPDARLGSKKKDPEKGHSEAVLDLSWNTDYPHILASSSADKTVALWDLETVTLSNKFDSFDGNVENIQWDREGGHCLLCSDSAGAVRILDCREMNTVNEWTVKGEALVARWSTNDTNHFYIGTSKGRIVCFDRRNQKQILKIKAHESDITGISTIAGYNGLLVSTCVGGDLNVWDTNSEPQRLVFNKSLNVEQAHSLDLSPDNPLLAAVGGAKKKGFYFSVINLNKNEALNELLNFRKAPAGPG